MNHHDYEARVLEMLADLAAADELPESIRVMNEAAVRSIAAGCLQLGPFSAHLGGNSGPVGERETKKPGEATNP